MNLVIVKLNYHSCKDYTKNNGAIHRISNSEQQLGYQTAQMNDKARKNPEPLSNAHAKSILCSKISVPMQQKEYIIAR